MRIAILFADALLSVGNLSFSCCSKWQPFSRQEENHIYPQPKCNCHSGSFQIFSSVISYVLSGNSKLFFSANSCTGSHTITNSASVSPTSAGQTGDAFTVSCSTGYTPSAASGTMQCDGSNVWTNKPTCNANSCNSGQTISNSLSVNPNPTSQSTGYSWSVTCNSGYAVSAASGNMICDPGGSWTNIPTCNARSCNAGQSIANSASVNPNPTNQSTGYSWTVSCNSGYTVSSGTGSMVCDLSGSWTNKPSCNANSCSSGQTIANSASVNPNPTSQSTGYSWTVSCNSGYAVSAGTGNMICNPGGTWTNIPSCNANTCNAPFAIAYIASLSPSVNSLTGTGFTASWNSGYTISAASGTMECDGSNVWTNKPTCNGKYCKLRE